jgi:Tfp pilus assembly protein FimT
MKFPAPSAGRARLEGGFHLLEVLFVMGLTAVIAAIAVPMTKNTLGDFRLRGDARNLTNAASLAKMRAASDFSQARLYADLSAKSFHVETWRKTGTPAWVTEGGIVALATSSSFSHGIVSTAPPNTQGTIGQSAACLNAAGTAIGNTACVLFNSRGIPVDSTGAPIGTGALYVTDSTAVYGVTVSATGLIRLWRTNPTATATWVLQ